MLRIVIRLVSAFFFVAGVVGAFTLPEDIPIALDRVGAAVKFVIERETLLIAFFALSSGGLLYTILAPAVQAWWKARRTPALRVVYSNEINRESAYGWNKRTDLFVAGGLETVVRRTCFYLGVENTTQKTIKSVSVYVHEIRNPIPYFLEARTVVFGTQDARIDLQPGLTAYFSIAASLDKHSTAEGVHVTDQATILAMASRLGEGSLQAWALLENGREIPLLPNNGIGVEIGVYGEDVPPTRHRLTLNARDRLEVFYDGPGSLPSPNARS